MAASTVNEESKKEEPMVSSVRESSLRADVLLGSTGRPVWHPLETKTKTKRKTKPKEAQSD